jgi:polar amino acid transport system permease protein
MNLPWKWDFAWSIVPALLDGLAYTCVAAILGSAIAILLGLALAVLRFARIPLVSPLAVFIINFLRGTPTLIQLYFVFYVLPHYGLTLSIMATGVLTLGISFSGYTAEVFRASIEAIRPGQWEACLAIGLPIPHVWGRVVLPQAMRTATPMLGNYVILMFKETALLSAIGLSELLGKGMEIGFLNFRFNEPLTMAAGMYFIVSYISARGVRMLENALHA